MPPEMKYRNRTDRRKKYVSTRRTDHTRACHALTFFSSFSFMPAIDRVGPWAANALGATLVRATVRLTRRAVLEIMMLLWLVSTCLTFDVNLTVPNGKSMTPDCVAG